MNEPRALPALFRQLVIRIPGRPPTANARRHWRSVARDNELWKGIATSLARAEAAEWESRHGLRWALLRRASVEVTFGVHTNAVRDWDNLIGSIKPLLDGLVAAKLLVDDSVRVIATIAFRWTFSKGKPYTEFSIVEVDS